MFGTVIWLGAEKKQGKMKENGSSTSFIFSVFPLIFFPLKLTITESIVYDGKKLATGQVSYVCSGL